MKKKLMKLLSMLMAMVMVLGMACTSLAATSSDEGTKFTITIEGAADGETYSAYKIFSVTYDYDNKTDEYNYSYTIDSTSHWLVNNDTTPCVYGDEDGEIFTLVETTVSGVYNVIINDGVDDDQIIAVLTKNGLPPQASAAASEEAVDGTVTLDVTNAGAGYYYVTTTLGSLVIIDTTNPDQTIEEKNGIPTVSKYVMENSTGDYGIDDDASNNDYVTFQIDIGNINGALNLVLHDSMDDELEIPDEADFHMDSVTLYKSSTDTGTTLEEGEDADSGDYYITVGNCTVTGCELTTCAFEIHFQDSLFDDVDESGHIVLVYKLLLDTEDDEYDDDYEEIENEAQVSFGTTSFSAVVYAETFSFGFETFKYTGTEQTPLEGVEFELKNTDGDDAVSAWFEEETVELEDGSEKKIYLFEGWYGDENLGDTSELTQTLVTASDGMIYVEGLDTGTYYLVETKALDGYNMLTGPVIVTITAEYDPVTGEMTSHTVTYTYGDESDTGVVNIENNAGKILPGTGGMGTTLFYIVGVVLILGAAVLFVTKKRLDREEQ